MLIRCVSQVNTIYLKKRDHFEMNQVILKGTLSLKAVNCVHENSKYSSYFKIFDKRNIYGGVNLETRSGLSFQ